LNNELILRMQRWYRNFRIDSTNFNLLRR